ncbi:hypothetical protein TNCV_3125541 [Trichonephila clavipes]|nr:hypothetical protein TNCV_3125541 [Trichonephila clavipes]
MPSFLLRGRHLSSDYVNLKYDLILRHSYVMATVDFLHHENTPTWAGVETSKLSEITAELEDIGNLIEGVIDFSIQINLEVDRDNIHELLAFHNQELTIDELIEMQEQDIEEHESLDPVQMTI